MSSTKAIRTSTTAADLDLPSVLVSSRTLRKTQMACKTLNESSITEHSKFLLRAQKSGEQFVTYPKVSLNSSKHPKHVQLDCHLWSWLDKIKINMSSHTQPNRYTTTVILRLFAYKLFTAVWQHYRLIWSR